jgi:hypothetical protein
MQKIHFLTFFLFLCVTDTQPNAIWIRPTKINPDPDPQHWREQNGMGNYFLKERPSCGGHKTMAERVTVLVAC